MKRRTAVIAASTAASLPLAAWMTAAQAATFPSGALKIVVPFPPGGLTDTMSRLVAQKLNSAWGQPVVVENRAGGNAQIGADQVAKGVADGSQILAITLTHAVNASLLPNASYSLTRDLRAVALLVGSPMLVVVPHASPIADFKGLVAASKARPLNAGSSGNGTPPHLTMAMFAELNKATFNHIPYRGGAPSMIDLIGGSLDVVFSNLPESIAHVKSGKLRALAVCSSQRHPLLPDVPTTAEVGMGDLLVENWMGLMAPAASPDAVVERYAKEVIKIMMSAEVEERSSIQGFRPSPKNAADFAVFLHSEIARWATLIKAAKLSAT